MKRVIVIGCPGSGKSVFSRELYALTNLPLYPLDLIRWREDRTIIPQEQLVDQIMRIVVSDKWIIDGNYGSTMELRMSYCDTIFFLDYPTEVCYNGIMQRRGKPRPDLPWVEPENETDAEFANFVLQYNDVNRPVVLERIRKFADREIHIFKSRAEASLFLERLKENVGHPI